MVAAFPHDTGLGELRAELNRAIVVPGYARVSRCVVTLDTHVIVEDQETGAIREIVLTLPESAELAPNAVSVADALGTALLGCSQGDVVTFHGGGGKSTLRILEVFQSPLAYAAARMSPA